MRDPRHPRHFTDEFKRQIVDLYNAGKPKREIMDEYDLGKSTVERPRATARPSRTGSWSSSARTAGSGWRSTS